MSDLVFRNMPLRLLSLGFPISTSVKHLHWECVYVICASVGIIYPCLEIIMTLLWYDMETAAFVSRWVFLADWLLPNLMILSVERMMDQVMIVLNIHEKLYNDWSKFCYGLMTLLLNYRQIDMASDYLSGLILNQEKTHYF